MEWSLPVENSGVGCALIGFGYWGPNLARNLQNVAGAKLLYICDRDQHELLRAARLYPGVQVTQSFETVLGDPAVDAVLIATPPATHHRLGMSALEDGKHVFVEKPLAVSTAAASELAGCARRRGRVLMVGHTFLYSPAVLKIKEIVRSGEIGEIRHISSSRLSLGLFQANLNVVWDLMPHDISMLLFLLDGLPLAGVTAAGADHVIAGVEDTVSAFLRFDGGPTADLRASWIHPQKVREFTVVGSRKMIVFDDTQQLDKVRVIERCLEVAQPSSNLGEFHMSYRYGDTHIPLLDNSEPLHLEMAGFIHSVRTGAVPRSDADMGVKVVSILESIQAGLEGQRLPSPNGAAISRSPLPVASR